MSNWFKRNGIHFAIIGIFLVICFLYFTPAFQGKVLGQADVTGAQSTTTEIDAYKAKDTTILWTNQIFGGMPAFQLWAPYNHNITTHVIHAMKAVFPNPIDTVLLLLLGTYFLFTVLKLNPWLAAAGAIAFTFSSYNIILLVAGHSNQASAIAYFAPLLASIILTLRGKHILGGSLTALFLSLEIRANHVQMTYYFMFAILILAGIELYHAIKAKTLNNYLKSLAYLGGALVLALMVNASILWSTYDYGKDTIRGQSNLSQHTTEPSSGLAKDYAYQWSQGVSECLTFLVPNAYGGATGGGAEALDQNSATAKVFSSAGQSQEQSVQFANQISGGFPGLTMYWGAKPSTSGPFYFGAVVCFLFIFGLVVVRSRLKWWLLGTVVLTMLLSFGGNWPVVSDLFFKYFPLYNKFRTVESVLAVAGLCFPILAFLAVKETLEANDTKYVTKKLLLAFYITGGLLIILIAVPDLILSFHSADQVNGTQMLAQQLHNDNAIAAQISAAVVQDRIGLERADAIRSLIFVILAFGILLAFLKHKITATIVSIGLLVLMLADFWQVDKRYLKDENFADKQETNAPQPREVDQFIQRDKDPDFRVFDTSEPLTYDLRNPFFHKSFGGYSAARLKRYQEIIDGQFTKSINHDVLDMMNVKYLITSDPKTQSVNMQANPTACGHAWFVQNVKYAQNADEEMAAISSFNPKEEAIIDQRYRSLINEKEAVIDTNSTIDLVNYNPDHMTYKSHSTATQIAVFSEVYYDKGWKMYIDGQETPYFRADYILRAAQIPVGNHTIEFKFHPVSYYAGETISLAGSILLILALGFAGYTENKKKLTEKKP
ncbi:YfhO family protein [Mucilaginibacter sp. dw_454]|uniref:YfhO family protein n=1 Tax=Mucilaginibacter sp. dw_454 TaxID=2720079 RepID=UPI001BD32AE5|nr:YfhO family protein [Mucilaginibacter sp. dw_454]